MYRSMEQCTRIAGGREHFGIMAFFGNDPRCQLFIFLGEYFTTLISLYQLRCILLRPKFENRSLHLRSGWNVNMRTTSQGPGHTRTTKDSSPSFPIPRSSRSQDPMYFSCQGAQHSTLHSASSRPPWGCCRGLSHLIGASHIYDITKCQVS